MTYDMKKLLFSILFITFVCSLSAQDLYRARQDGHVDSVYAGIDLPDSYTGRGVIIGVTDWGFDYTHPVFYDTTGTQYRVLRAWDQFRNAGPAPAGFDYGTELVGREQLVAAACDTSNIYGHHYHGTHVASIAGGSGAGTIYRGVAPDAEFIFASFRPDEQSVIDAFEWMYQVAQQEQKRLVINMSWGLYWMDNFDGTGPVGQKMQELSNLGVVFVTSGGNNGDEQFHLGHTFNNDTLRSRFQFPADNNSPYYWGTSLSMTNSPGKPFSVRLNWCNNQYQTIDASPFFHTADGDNYTEGYLTNGTDTIIYNIELIASDESGRPEARLCVKRPAIINSIWRFGIEVAGTSGEFHAWNVAELTTGVGNWGGKWVGVNVLGWKYGDSQYGTGTPACVDCAITVAAHQSGNWEDDVWHPGDICNFSSYGPTIDGRDKPDISAPGYGVISANSSYADEHNSAVATVTFEGREYSFISLSGTSMSSPFTTGVVALLLEANPTLTPQQVKESLIFSATHDSLTEARGMVRFGHGKVNAYQAVLRALYHVGTQAFTSHANIYTVFPNPASDQIFISTPNDQEPATATLYDLNGRMIQTLRIEQGVNTLNVNPLPNGTYILRIATPTQTQSQKVVIAR